MVLLVRRDGILDLSAPTTELHRTPSTGPIAPYLDAGRPRSPGHIFKSASSQRPPLCEVKPKIYRCIRADGRRFKVNAGGRNIGPASYNTPRPTWIHEPSQPHSSFANTTAQRHTPIPPLSADMEALPTELPAEVRMSVSATSPLKGGARWGKHPRLPSPRPRDPGLDRSLEPDNRSVATAVVSSPRKYATLSSQFERFPDPRPTTPSIIGPGCYDGRPVGMKSSSRTVSAVTGTTSPAFLSPRHSKAARLEEHIRRTARECSSPRALASARAMRRLMNESAPETLAWDIAAARRERQPYGGDWLASGEGVICNQHWVQHGTSIYRGERRSVEP